MFTYLSIRLAVVAIVLYLAYRAVVERGFLRRNWQGLLVFATFYALTFAPLAFTYYKEPFTFLNRSRQVSIAHDIEAAGGSLAPLLESAKRHLLMFHVAGDANGRHNLPGAPMLDPITGAFFLLGVGCPHLDRGDVVGRRLLAAQRSAAVLPHPGGGACDRPALRRRL